MLGTDFSKVLSDDFSSTMDTNRNCSRRIRHGEEEQEYSKHSILHAMGRFVKSVNDMDETILVPCRLMDMKLGDDKDNAPKDPRTKRMLKDMTSIDLFSLYTMVNTVKNELLWGKSSGALEESAATTTTTPSVPTSTSPPVKGHVRRSSTVSMTSTHSTVSCSDTESDAGNENDSGVEGEEDAAQQVTDNFRQHLHGLYVCLHQMTEAANYITTRYQNDIGGAV